MNKLTVTEFKGIRVLTTQQLAESYETTDKKIRDNFSNNQARYIEGKHFVKLEGEELKSFKDDTEIIGTVGNRASSIYLWTEKGALLHAKSLGTDKAWETYDILVDTYFKAKQFKQLTRAEEMRLYLEVIEEQDVKIEAVNTDLQAFKMDMPILGLECDRITHAVKTRGVKCLGGKQSNAYQDSSLRGRVYSDIHGQLKREFGVTSYKAIKRSQTETAIEIINTYRLPMALEEEITDLNCQLCM